jgi:beta-glucosidase
VSGPPRFPDGFLWGAATSAYQIEGSPLADGAGVGIWHRFSHTPGRTLHGGTGDVACDHYRRWREDVALMRELGLGSYRFGLAWTRILPEGTGRVNPKGLEFYSRLVDALLEAGITPMATLYHWDLPAALDDLGGWLNAEIADAFADFAEVCFRALDDRVPLWCTINEPWVIVDGGYLFGVNAPGHRNLFEAPIASHHLLRAHAEAVRRYRAIGGRHRIGLVVNLAPHHPATESPEDVAAARRGHTYFNEQYLDPVMLGENPPGMRAIFGPAWPDFAPQDVSSLREPGDFLGVNWYTGYQVRHDDSAPPVRLAHVPRPNAIRMTTGWEVVPEGLTETLLWVTERYGRIPIVVTENGAAFEDPDVAPPGGLDDPLRVDYLRRHVPAVGEAIARGADVRGYYVWSLLDNFEWHSGYRHRMGLVHVDYATQKRTIKSSGRFYRELIRANGAVLGAGAPTARG